MGICWYCHWGWASEVASIYSEALKRLNGDDSPLHYGPAHIVWEDENFEDHSVNWCLKNFGRDKGYHSEHDLSVVRWSLEELLKLPEELRCPEPENYDGEHPNLYPPKKGLVMVKVF